MKLGTLVTFKGYPEFNFTSAYGVGRVVLLWKNNPCVVGVHFPGRRGRYVMAVHIANLDLVDEFNVWVAKVRRRGR